ncbi:MAG: ATP phosphoribosyltransferase regulatory subunit [Hyphomicrobiaceae bacterium]
MVAPRPPSNDNLLPSELPQSARWIEALDRQTGIIMGIFVTAGFEPIAPAVIQPADVFLDLIGEDLRARTYVFTDPDGAELCLRPDLTIPACRLYLDRHRESTLPARYTYSGGVFRYQPAGSSLTHPREIRQAGIESFAAADPGRAEAEILALSVEAVRAAGLRAFRLRIGDLGIFNALLEGLDMPLRWRARLKHHFWRPEAFRAQLARLVAGGSSASRLPAALVAALETAPSEDAAAIVGDHLVELGLEATGTRGIDEIAEQLLGEIADLRAPPLGASAAAALDAYLAVATPAPMAADRVRKLAREHRIGIEPAVTAFERRLSLAAEEGVDLTQAQFSGGFGRAFEYYTGFVFEILSPAIGDTTPIGGGGRYDTLVEAISGNLRVPAVGAAVHTERLLLAVRGGRP